MGSLTRMPMTEVMATLELLEALGLTLEDWKALRKALYRPVAESLVKQLHDMMEVVAVKAPVQVEEELMLCSSIPGGLTSVTRARQILGHYKVISSFHASQAWGKKADSRFPIRYSEATLRECAEQNATGEADWRLVFCNGLSLRQQREIQGATRFGGKKQPCFAKLDWWLKSKADAWASKSLDAGYRLVDVRPRFAGEHWETQQKLILALGEQFERCDEHVFAEVIQTIFLMSKKSERIAESWYHWGNQESSDGGMIPVMVGNFGRKGLEVRNACKFHYMDEYTGYYDISKIRVCVSLKSDF